MSSSAINWRPSIDERGGTPGLINSQFNRNPDDQPPRIVIAYAESAASIVVEFDEPVEPDAMIIRVDSIVCKELDRTKANEVHCIMEYNLENGVEYALSITGVRDTANNVMPPAELSIKHFVPAEVNYKDVIINEIMADPLPPVGLPEIEYVELYNRSRNAVQLQGWVLSDNNSNSLLPGWIILPNDYLVLTTSHTSESAEGRKWVEVAGGLTLSNTGEYLVIRAPGRSQVDSVNYDQDWFRESEKKEGGWSLELIDPSNPCGEDDNWAASEDESGGTPGMPNSILASKPDVTGPRMTGVTVHSSRSLFVSFNEKLSVPINRESIALNPGSGVVTVSFSDQSRRTILVSLENELKPSTPYELKARGLYDCNRNALQDKYSSAQFILPEDPLDGDVVINEVLFNPRIGGPDFVEIYNRGSRYVDLNGWKLVRTDQAAANVEGTIDESLILPP